MSKEDINQRAKTFIETHKNPLKKLELPGTKFFLPAGSKEEGELVNSAVDSIAKAFKNERVERRCARSVANWLPEKKLAIITKGSGIPNNFGFANKNGKFLFPEEIMFLLETNRLELFWNNVPLSVQQAYEVIHSDNHSLAKYLTYRTLALQGFRLQRAEIDSEEPACKKPKLSENQQSTCKEANKSIKLESQATNSASAINIGDIYDMTHEIFAKLKETGPKKYAAQPHQVKDYKIFASDNSSRVHPDYNLYISHDKSIEPTVACMEDKAVLAYVTSESAGYYQFGSIDLPFP